MNNISASYRLIYEKDAHSQAYANKKKVNLIINLINIVLKNTTRKNTTSRLCFYLMFSLIFISLFISSLNGVYALGVAPGERSFVYANQPIEYNVRIINDDSKAITYDIEVNGELSQYVTLSKKSVSFTSQQADETISVKFFIPEGEKTAPGDYTIRLIVKGEQSSTTGVVAFVGVISKLTLSIPGNDAYVKANVFVPNFVKGQSNSFSVDITNKGVKPAENCFAVVDVMTSLNSKVVSLISDKITVQGTRVEKLYISWTPSVNNGNYLAKASVICDGTASEDEKQFSIGSPEVNVVSFKTDAFTLGQINKFDLILGSEWGENIPSVYADIDVAKDGASIFRAKTESTDMQPLEKIVLPVYLDTKGMAPGKYSLYIMLHYLDKDVGEAYNVQMGTNDIVIDRLSGMVTGGGGTGKGTDSSGGGGTNGLLIMAIIIIVVVNVVLVFRLLKKKNK